MTIKKTKSATVKYFVLNGEHRVPVCKQVFLLIHAVSRKCCERLVLLLKQQSPRDMRGRNVSGNATKDHVIANVCSHIESYPVKLSHCTNHEIWYFDCRLSVKPMYEIFIQKYPEDKISYKFFWAYFKENYNLRFGQPAKDTKTKNQTLNENAKRVAVAELLVHKRRSKKFEAIFDSIKHLCENQDDTLAICVNYMANVSLP